MKQSTISYRHLFHFVSCDSLLVRHRPFFRHKRVFSSTKRHLVGVDLLFLLPLFPCMLALCSHEPKSKAVPSVTFDSVPREAETFSMLIYRDTLEGIHFLGDEFLQK